MKMKSLFLLLAFSLLVTNVKSQPFATDTTYRKFFIGSTLLVLENLIPNDPNPPSFIQLNFGYRITPRDVVSVEAKTWKYAWPLGIPYGKSFEAPDEKYPGHIRDYGIAVAYQRFWWKGAYTAVHAMNALQKYVGDDNKKIQNGYMLFMTYRLGYCFSFFKNRFFVEPSVVMTHWPLKTNTPEAFAAKERNWPRVFFPEPGLHFGVKF